MYKVRQLLAKLGEPEPHFLLSCAWTAEDAKGEIVGLSQAQSILVIEPFKMVTSSYSYDGAEVLGNLFEMTQEFIVKSGAPRVLMHTGHPAMKRMLTRKVGAVRMTDEFFDWRKRG